MYVKLADCYLTNIMFRNNSRLWNSKVRVASLLLLATTRKFVLSLVCVGLQTLLSFQLPYLVISYTSRWIQVCSCFKLYASKINGTCIPSVSCYFLHLMLKSEMILQSVFFTSHDALVSLLVLGLDSWPMLISQNHARLCIDSNTY